MLMNSDPTPETQRAASQRPARLSTRLVLLSLVISLCTVFSASAQSVNWDKVSAPVAEDLRLRTSEEMRGDLQLLVAQTELLGSIVGLPADTIERLHQVRTAMGQIDPQGLELVAHEAGAEVARLNRILANVNRSTGEIALADLKSAGFPDAVYPNSPVPGLDLSGDPPDVESCGDPETDEYTDCVADLFGIDRPDNVGAALCRVAERKSPSTLFGLKIGVAVAETVAVILNRVCELNVVGFNVSLVCIPSDLVYLALRAAEDFILLCEDLLTASEALGNYERIGHLHGDLTAAQSSLDSLSSSLSTHDGNLVNHDQNLASHDAELMLHDQALVAHDQSLADHDQNLVDHDANVQSLLATLQSGADKNKRLVFEALRLMLTPNGQREIDGAFLTCEGDDCPMLQPCANGKFDFPCK